MSFAVIDFQGFKLCDEKSRLTKFIIKEFALYDGDQCVHLVFKPPFAKKQLQLYERKNIQWVHNFHHGLDWNIGNEDLDNFPEKLCDLLSNYSQVYIKGLEKMVFIKDMIKSVNGTMPDIIEIYSNAFRLKDVSKSYCKFHSLSKPFAVCALFNVKFMYSYLVNKIN